MPWLPAPTPDAPPELFLQLIGTAPFEHLDLVRRGQPVERFPLEGRWEAALQKTVEGLVAGDWLYVRAQQIDNGVAWSSPIFIE